MQAEQKIRIVICSGHLWQSVSWVAVQVLHWNCISFPTCSLFFFISSGIICILLNSMYFIPIFILKYQGNILTKKKFNLFLFSIHLKFLQRLHWILRLRVHVHCYGTSQESCLSFFWKVFHHLIFCRINCFINNFGFIFSLWTFFKMEDIKIPGIELTQNEEHLFQERSWFWELIKIAHLFSDFESPIFELVIEQPEPEPDCLRNITNLFLFFFIIW